MERLDRSPTRARRSRRAHLAGFGAGLASVAVLAACGGATGAPAAPTPGSGSAAAPAAVATGAPAAAAPAVPAQGNAPAAAPTPAAPVGAPAAGAAGKVSANRATRAELQRAFEAAGIPNPGRLAVEVEEYRPYPSNDPGMAKLRRELAKYNIAPAVVDQVIATLSLD